MRDGIILYRALLDEVRHNMEAEKTAVSTFCRQLHETVSQLQQRLLADVEGYGLTGHAQRHEARRCLRHEWTHPETVAGAG